LMKSNRPAVLVQFQGLQGGFGLVAQPADPIFPSDPPGS
jgi:hypothetical protein